MGYLPLNRRISGIALTARKAFWHFRTGGLEQLRKFRRNDTRLPNYTSYRKQMKSDSMLTSAKAFEAIAAQLPSSLTKSGYTLSFAASEPLNPPRSVKGLRVAVILDDFSLQAWGYEFEPVVIDPENWQTILENQPIDFLLVESAWAGNHGSWQYHLTGSSAPRSAVVELLKWCKVQNIPSVFWNKEDPPHFEDFLDTARLFDVVFTSDSRLIPKYREELDSNRVFAMPFAAQPAIHNPVRPAVGVQARGVAFAGTYFTHKFEERRQQMDVLLSGAREAATRNFEKFEIYSRFLGQDAKYQFPKPLDEHVVGSLSYPQMLTAYKAHKIFLNVNSVVDSPSMCARRIFEILASGTPVVTTDSAALANFFNEQQLTVVHSEQDATAKVRALLNSAELRDRSVHLAQREIWSRHTYSHRLHTVLKSIGLDKPGNSLSFGGHLKVSVIVSTVRPSQLEHVFKTVAAQTYLEVQLAVLTHGFTLSSQDFMAQANQYGLKDVVLLSAPSELSLGECLNLLVDSVDGDVIAKMDDDDLYGDHYLEDMVNALKFSGADVVGKNAHYAYLESSNATVLRRAEMEHRFTHFIAGPTLTARAEVMRRYRFEHRTTGEDTAFLQAVCQGGGSIYAADRFNFIQIRKSAHKHTWQANDLEFMANGTVVFFGDNATHAMF